VLAGGSLGDPVLAVRIEAVSLLASVPAASLSSEDQRRSDYAALEYVAGQRFNVDRPEGRVTLGAFYAQRGEPAKAETEYRAAIRLAPRAARRTLQSETLQ
jgi:hypothetical protein